MMDIRDAVDIWRRWVPLEGPSGFSRRIEISGTEVRPWVEAYIGVIELQSLYHKSEAQELEDAIEAITLLVELERGRKQ